MRQVLKIASLNIILKTQRDTKMSKPKLGTGARFRALSTKLEEKGAKDPDALAAYIGRKKYGEAKFEKLGHHKS